MGSPSFVPNTEYLLGQKGKTKFLDFIYRTHLAGWFKLYILLEIILKNRMEFYLIVLLVTHQIISDYFYFSMAFVSEFIS